MSRGLTSDENNEPVTVLKTSVPAAAKQGLSFEAVRAAARNRWHVILPELGIPSESLHNKHQPCPGCGGRDRFRFDDKDGTGSFFCGGGGSPTAGDGFALIQHVTGCNPAEALRQVAGEVGPNNTPRPRPEVRKRPARLTDAGERAYARQLWSMAEDHVEPWSNIHRLDATVAAHPYCRRKTINNAFGAARVRERGRDLLVTPIRAHGAGELLAVQTIDPDGGKLTYGRMDDPDGNPGYLLLGDERDRHHTWVVVEGWGTAWAVAGSLRRLMRPAPVLVAFGGGRLQKVAIAAKQRYGAAVTVLREGALWV